VLVSVASVAMKIFMRRLALLECPGAGVERALEHVYRTGVIWF